MGLRSCDSTLHQVPTPKDPCKAWVRSSHSRYYFCFVRNPIVTSLSHSEKTPGDHTARPRMWCATFYPEPSSHTPTPVQVSCHCMPLCPAHSSLSTHALLRYHCIPLAASGSLYLCLNRHCFSCWSPSPCPGLIFHETFPHLRWYLFTGFSVPASTRKAASFCAESLSCSVTSATL